MVTQLELSFTTQVAFIKYTAPSFNIKILIKSETKCYQSLSANKYRSIADSRSAIPEDSFQLRLEGSGCGLGGQQPQCVLVVVGLLLFGHTRPFWLSFSG